MRILLISNSGKPYLAHCARAILEFVGGRKKVAFITAAYLGDEEAYFEMARQALRQLDLLHLRWDRSAADTLDQAEALFVGGGNTYALLQRIRQAGLLDAIRMRVHHGMPYVGSSGGANIAGPNILTTNDWNVVGLVEFEAIALVSFNINPHYLEVDPGSAPGGETRDDRIREYHYIWTNPVVGITEETMIRIEGSESTVLGRGGVRVFERNKCPRWIITGEPLDVPL